MSKPRLANSDYCRAADHLGCEVASIKAVAEQESLGAGFDAQDRPVILFERHLFHKFTKGVYDKSHPNISTATPGGYGSSASQYGRFSEAFALNPQAAMKATSWGKFQILGMNYAICGYSTVDAFVDAMKESEAKQLDAFCAFVLYNGLDIALTDRDWAAFADGFNGHGFRKNHYDTKIAAGYTRFSKENIDCGKISTAALLEQQTDDTPTTTGNVVDDSNSANSITPEQPLNTSEDVPLQPVQTQTADTIVNAAPIAPPTPAPTDVSVVAATPSWKTTLAAAGTAIWGYYQVAKENFSELIDRATGAIDAHILINVFIGAGFIALAYWLYNHSQQRAHEKTLALIQAATDPAMNNVTMQG